VSGATMQVDEERVVEPPGRYPLLSSLLPAGDAFSVQPRANIAAARAGVTGAVPLTAPVTVDDELVEWTMGRGDKRTKKGKRFAKSHGNSRPKKPKKNSEEAVLDADPEQPALAEREELLASLDRALEKAAVFEARVGDAVTMVAGATKNKKAKAATRKAKTSSAASKRFKATSTGKLLRHFAGKAHLLRKKRPQHLAALRRTGQVSEPQLDTYQALLGVVPKKKRSGSVSVEEDEKEAVARAGEPSMIADAEVADLEEVLDAAEDTVLLLEMLRLSKVDVSRRGFPSMSTAVEDVMEKLKSMTLLEASELVKAIEETFDVDASVGGGMMMAAPMAGGAVGGGDAAAAEEKTEFDLVLDSFPADKKIAVLKIVRELTGLGLKDAKEKVEAAPCTLKEGASKAECEEAQKKLEEAGATAAMK